jgi:hypothetical protein
VAAANDILCVSETKLRSDSFRLDVLGFPYRRLIGRITLCWQIRRRGLRLVSGTPLNTVEIAHFLLFAFIPCLISFRLTIAW